MLVNNTPKAASRKGGGLLFNMRSCRIGFTLLEIMITLAIIAILAVIAFPNFVKYRAQTQMSACISNLKRIDEAYENAKLMGSQVTGADGVVSVSALVGNDKYIKTHLFCPVDKSKLDDAAYEIGEDEQPLCIAHGADEEFPHRLTEP